MANIIKMHEFFGIVDDLIDRLAADDAQTKNTLREFFFRIMAVCDGVEGPEGWKGIALVAAEDAPPSLPEINDEFLHDAWSNGRTTDRS